MERLFYTVQTPEEALDDELFDMYRGKRGEYLASDECEDDRLYWGGGRSIGELAICRGRDEYGRMQFEGLRNKLGIDLLWIEIHEDDDPQFGTFTPLIALEVVPATLTNEEETMQWILRKEIDFFEVRIEWLLHMPAQFNHAPSYEWLIERDTEILADRLRTQDEGFNNTPAPTFRQIIEAKQQQLTDANGDDQLVEAAGE